MFSTTLNTNIGSKIKIKIIKNSLLNLTYLFIKKIGVIIKSNEEFFSVKKSILNPANISLKADSKNNLIEKLFGSSGISQDDALLLVKDELMIGPNIKKIIKKNIR